MCLIALAYHMHPRYDLVLIGNRDEFHARPTRAADFLDETRLLYGGQDLQAGGGWLQVHRSGALTTVTNVRLGTPESAPRSRGALVRSLIETARPSASLGSLSAKELQSYGRFNLLTYDSTALTYARNHPEAIRVELSPGLYGLSNAALDAPWPKTQAAKQALQAWLEADADDPAPLFECLSDTRIYPDHLLPDTGIGQAHERILSAAFILGEHYGTRASSVVLVDNRHIRFIERNFAPLGGMISERDELIERVPA